MWKFFKRATLETGSEGVVPFWYFLVLSTDGRNCAFRYIRAHCIVNEICVVDLRNTSLYALSPKSELLRMDENNLLFRCKLTIVVYYDCNVQLKVQPVLIRRFVVPVFYSFCN